MMVPKVNVGRIWFCDKVVCWLMSVGWCIVFGRRGSCKEILFVVAMWTVRILILNEARMHMTRGDKRRQDNI